MPVTLERRPDWRERLAAVANERRALPYRYGTNDCASFARAAIEAMTGTLLLPEVEPPTGWISAAKILIDRGWTNIEEMMTSLVGDPRELALSRPGDVVSFELVGEYHLAVRVGDTALSPGMRELVEIDRRLWRRAWLIG